MHRTRGQEGKDGNPLNEIRVLVESIIDHDGIYTPGPKMKLDPADTVIGLSEGDVVQLGADDFARILPAFLHEITRRFPDDH